MDIHVSISNFRGIKQGNIKLFRFNILLGPNNSGKSTILEALYLAPNPIRHVPYAEIYEHAIRFRQMQASEIIHKIHKTYESEGYAFLLHNYRAKEASIEIRLNEESYTVRLLQGTSNIDVILEENNEASKRFYLCSLRKYFVGYDTHPETNKAKKMSHLPNTSGFVGGLGDTMYIHPSLIGYAWNYIAYRWAEIAGPEITMKVAKSIGEAIGEDYVDMLLEPFGGGKSSLYLYTAKGRRIRLGDVGDGVKQIATLMLLHKITKPRLLLIDDVESHMNPAMLSFLARWIVDVAENNNSIVVVSTHSIEAAKILLNLAADIEPRVILTNLKNGILQTRALNKEELEELETSGVDVRIATGLLI